MEKRLRRGTPHRRDRRGSVLIDVLVTLLVASTALLITLAGISLAARAAQRSAARVAELIASRNDYARNRQLVFTQHASP